MRKILLLILTFILAISQSGCGANYYLSSLTKRPAEDETYIKNILDEHGIVDLQFEVVQMYDNICGWLSYYDVTYTKNSDLMGNIGEMFIRLYVGTNEDNEMISVIVPKYEEMDINVFKVHFPTASSSIEKLESINLDGQFDVTNIDFDTQSYIGLTNLFKNYDVFNEIYKNTEIDYDSIRFLSFGVYTDADEVYYSLGIAWLGEEQYELFSYRGSNSENQDTFEFHSLITWDENEVIHNQEE
jgi:hypothetical protein